MVSMVGRMAGWARRSTSFAELGCVPPLPRPQEPAGNEPIYRLRKWPSLPQAMHTAAVLRLLSVMSTRPVNRGWMVRHTQLPPTMVDQLIERLCRNGDVEVIDPSGFAPLTAQS
jgi:hypothetical protein